MRLNEEKDLLEQISDQVSWRKRKELFHFWKLFNWTLSRSLKPSLKRGEEGWNNELLIWRKVGKSLPDNIIEVYLEAEFLFDERVIQFFELRKEYNEGFVDNTRMSEMSFDDEKIPKTVFKLFRTYLKDETERHQLFPG